MSLADRLKTAPKLSFEDWLDTLTPEDFTALEAAAVDARFSTLRLTQEIEAEGHTVSATTVMKWRRSLGYTR